jgi:glycolate oxidase iron-sulfur subunit
MNSTSLPVIHLDPSTYSKFNACVHCGLCLPACPTYVETMDEADSPRGRIHLMKAIADARIVPSAVAFEHLDRCLVCRACETACPSGVEYHDLIEAVRPQVAQAVLGKGKRVENPILQWMVEHVLPYQKRATVAMAPLKVARKVGLGALANRVARMMGGPMGAMTDLAPADAAPDELAGFHAAKGDHRGHVVLLRGCVGSLVSGDVNAACVRVLTENGFDIHLLAAESCCGALAAHANDPDGARRFAVALVDQLEAKGGDFFVSPIAGCGAQLKSLDHVLADVPGYADRSRDMVRKMRDITEFLAEIDLRPPTRPIERTVTYHDPCHLIHAQRIADAPRQLLALIPGLKIVKLPENDMCCGAAGTYSLNQPDMAARLGRRKVAHIQSTGAAELITANVGCALQIARHLKARGLSIRVRHVVELLAESYDSPA